MRDVVQRILDAVARTADPEVIVRVALREIRAAFDADAASIRVKRPNGALALRFVDGFAQESERDAVRRTADDSPLARKVARQRRPAAVDVAACDPAVRDTLAARGLRSQAASPVLRDGAVIAVLSVARREGAPFTPADLDLLLASANVLADVLDKPDEIRSSRDRSDGALRAGWGDDLFAALPLGVTIWRVPEGRDHGLVLEAFNPQAERQLNAELAPRLGENIEQVWPDIAGSTMATAMLESAKLRGGSDAEGVHFGRAPAPSGVLAVRTRPLTPGRTAVFMENVTDQAVGDEAQWRQERQQLDAEELGRVGSWEWRISPDVVSMSAELRRIVGLEHHPASALPGPLVRACVHPDDLAVVEACARQSLSSRDPFDVEMRVLRPDGVTRQLYVRGRPVSDADGAVSRIIGVSCDITDRRQTEARAERSELELRAVSARLVTAREEERTRIAREIHDELGQSLTALKMDIAWIQSRLSAGEDGRAALIERADEMMKLLDRTVGSVRRIASDLRPAVLDEIGLPAALEWQAGEFQLRTGVECRVDSSIKGRRIPRDAATTAFRIFQEALTNVARHAKAGRVKVRLSKEPGDWLKLEVADDGRGITNRAIYSEKSIGLIGMRERAAIAGGDVDVDGAPGQGTTVRLRLPLSSSQSTRHA